MIDIFNEKTNLTDIISWLDDRLYFLKENGATIQAQPLGMMRLALNGQKNSEGGLFLHFWAPDLPKSMSEPPLHTHVFHLKSRIIAGTIQDTLYKAVLNEAGDYQLIDAKCTEQNCSIINNTTIQRVNLEIEASRKFSSGEIYEVPKGAFHLTSFPEENKLAITIIEKSDVDIENPVLAVAFSSKLDLEPFSRDQLDQNFSWNRILTSLSFLQKKAA